MDITKYEKKISSGVLFFFLVMLMGLYDLARAGFNPAIYLTGAFYINLVFRGALKLLSDKIGNDIMFDRNAQCKVNVRTKKLYNNATTYIKLDIDKYCDEYNLKTKIKFYEKHLTKKRIAITKKIKKTKDAVKLEKYNIILKEIIADYDINDIDIKYPKLFPSHFLVDEGGSEKLEYKFQSDYNTALLKASFKNIATYILISAMFGSLIFEMQNPNINMLYDMLYNGFIVVIALSSAIYKSKRIYDKAHLVPLNNKLNILKQYFDWSEEININFNEIVKEIDKEILEEEKLIVTEKQADRIQLPI